MQEKDIIQGLNSPWASPMLLVTKKNDTSRSVWITASSMRWQKHTYPLPGIDMTLYMLAGSQWFSSSVDTGRLRSRKTEAWQHSAWWRPFWFQSFVIGILQCLCHLSALNGACWTQRAPPLCLSQWCHCLGEVLLGTPTEPADGLCASVRGWIEAQACKVCLFRESAIPWGMNSGLILETRNTPPNGHHPLPQGKYGLTWKWDLLTPGSLQLCHHCQALTPLLSGWCTLSVDRGVSECIWEAMAPAYYSRGAGVRWF